MRSILSAIFIFLAISTAGASQYNYMAAEDLKKRISSNDDILIIDIQVKEEFDQHHIPGSLATHAFPVKSDDERARLTPIVKLQQNDSWPLVIVCPREAGGAKRTYDYFVDQGIPSHRLWILNNGMSGWDYVDLTTAVN